MSGLLRICTAGSVDDGKSTLIGRLLYDSRGVYEDQVALGREGVEEPHRRADRFLAVHRRPAGRARAGHHDRRRLPLLRDRAAQVHPRRHARARAVHAQHGDRRVDGRRRDPAGRRAPRRARRSRGGTRASRGCSASTTSCSPSTRWTWSTSTASVFDDICDDFAELLPARRLHADSDQRAARRQRHHARASGRRGSTGRALLEYPRDRRSRPRRRRQAVPLAGAARAPAGPRLPRLRRTDRRRARSASAIAVTVWPSGRRPRVDADRHLGRRPRRGVRADVGDARRSTTRSTSAAATCWRGGAGRGRPAASRPTSCGWTSGRSIRRASTC